MVQVSPEDVGYGQGWDGDEGGGYTEDESRSAQERHETLEPVRCGSE